MKKKFLSLVLVLVMVISLCPTLASAASTSDLGYWYNMGIFTGQTVTRWKDNVGNQKYNQYCRDGFTQSASCNMCSLAMILSNKQGKQITPIDVVKANGHGLSGSLGDVNAYWGTLANAYGVQFHEVSCNNEANIKQALASHPEGLLVCYRTTSGGYHYVVAKQIKNNTVYYNDPGKSNGNGITLSSCYKFSRLVSYRIVGGKNSSGGSVDKTIYASGIASPSNLQQGSIFNVRGQLSCAISITKVEAYVYNSSNVAVTGTTVTPNTTGYDLASIDNYVRFSKLAEGTYTYKIVAYNSYGAQQKLNVKFTVFGKPTNVKISASPVITTSSNNVKLSWSATNAEKYWLNIYKDGKHIFNNSVGTSKTKSQKYSAGYYTAWIEAINSVGASQAVSCNFVVSDVTTSSNITNGTYRLISKLDAGKSITVADGALANNLNVCLRTNYSSTRQQFILQRQSDNTYTISLNDKFGFDVYYGAQNANLELWTKGNTSTNTNQRFYLKDAGSGWYNIIAQKTGQAVTAASKSNNANLSLAPLVNSDDQKFKIAVPVKGISIDQKEVEIKEGENAKLTATITPSNAYDKSITWASSNESIATVSANGTVTGKSEGTATITAVTKDSGKKVTCTVTVNKPIVTEGTCGNNLNWRIYDGTLEIDGSGAMNNYNSQKDVPWADSADTITKIVVDDNVTTIGNNAFNGLSNVTDIQLPDQMSSVGIAAFKNCSRLTNVSVPSGIAEIPDECFSGCTNLESANIPTSVIKIGQNAFGQCNSFSRVLYDGSAAKWNTINIGTGNTALVNAAKQYAEVPVSGQAGPSQNWEYKDGTLTITGTGTYGITGTDPQWSIPEIRNKIEHIVIEEGITGVNAINSYCGHYINGTGYNAGMFAWLENLKDVQLPSTLKSISMSMFAECPNLKQIEIPNGVNEIGWSAFCNTGIEEITLPATIKTIGNGAFEGSELKTILIPDGVTVIKGTTFRNCKQLETAIIPQSVKSIGADAFAGCSFSSFEIPNTVVELGNNAFAHNINLKQFIIPDSVKTVGSGVCYGDEALEKVVLGSSVESVGNAAFYGCSGLKSVSLPRSLKTIGDATVCNCDSIEEVKYAGSEDEWSAIEISGNNDELLDRLIFETPATITIVDELVDDVLAIINTKIDLYTEVTGDDINYDWQVSEDCQNWSHLLPEDDDEEEPLNSNAKLKLMSNNTQEGSSSIAVTAKADNPILYYRCEITDSTNSTRYTHPVMVAVIEENGNAIKEDPENKTVQVGDTVTFSVKTDEEDLTFQWLQCDPGTEEWSNSAYQGNNTDTLTVTATEENAGTQFKCIVTDSEGSNVESDVAILDTKKNLEIVNQAVISGGDYGFTTELSIDAVGTELSFKWEESDDNGATWKECAYGGNDTNTLEVLVSEDNLNKQFRCLVEDRYGDIAISENGFIKGPEEAVEVEDQNPIATLKSHTLSLTGDIGIIYNLYLSEEALNDKDAKVVFTYSGNDQGSVPISDGVKKIDNNGNAYYGYCCEVHSSQMTGKVIAKVVLSDGRESEEFQYTVKEYADIIIKNKNNSAAYTEVTPLVKAMLNYGGYAQEFFRYENALPLANADLTESERDVSSVNVADLAKYASVKQGTAPEGISYKSATLILTSKTTIRYSFRLAEGHDISEFTFKNGNQVLTPYHLSDDVYCVEIPDVASDELDNMYTVTVGDFSVTYGALTYAYNKLKAETTATNPETLKNLLRALVLYNQKANEYFV